MYSFRLVFEVSQDIFPEVESLGPKVVPFWRYVYSGSLPIVLIGLFVFGVELLGFCVHCNGLPS